MNVVGHHTPDHEVILFFDESCRVNGVLSDELDHATSSIESLDGELVVQQRNDDVVVLGVHAAIDQERITLVDTDPCHGIAFDTKHIGRCFVTDQLLVKVNPFFCVICCR